MEAKCVMQRNNGFGPGVCTRRGMCMDRDSGQFGRQMERGGGSRWRDDEEAKY